MERQRWIIVGVAVLLGLLAVYLANAWFSGIEEQQAKIAQEQELVDVAVANQDLAFGSPLTAETVRLTKWPRQSLPAGAISDLGQLRDAETNREKVAIRSIARGEPILSSRISGRAVLSKNIPDNMRAVTVPVGAVTGVAGFVFPGDTVDLFLTRNIPGDGASSDDKMTTVLLENIQVLAVDRRASENANEPLVAKTATLLVDPMAAQKLSLATQVGRLSMALRNVEDQLQGFNRVVTTRDLGGRGIYIPERGSRLAANRAPASQRPMSRPAPTPRVFRAEPPQKIVTPQPPSGPTMTIVRGTQATNQEVRRHGR